MKPRARLVVRHHYAEHEFWLDSVGEAVREALSQLENDVSYPDFIEVDGVKVWNQPGPFEVSAAHEILDKLTENEKLLLEFFGLACFMDGIDPCTRTLRALAERYPDDPLYAPYGKPRDGANETR